MNIGVDIRPLMSGVRTGVGEYTYELLNALFALDKTNEYYLFYNSYKNIKTNLPPWKNTNTHYVCTAWPNKVFNAMVKFVHQPKLDKLLPAKIETFFSPNLNFTSLSPSIKNILTIHDLSFEFFPEFFTPKRQWWHKIINPKKQCQRADVIVVPSENTKRDIVNKYQIDHNKIKVIYPGLSSVFYSLKEDSFSRAKQQIKKKYFLPDNFILFLGTIEPRKNIEGIIKAFEEAHAKLPEDCKLIIAGAPGWKNKSIYNIAARSPKNDDIKFIGYIDPEDKPALYASARLFIYPSFYEGFGFPALEAMAMGVPVITSNRSSLPEITCGGATLVNPNSIQQIKEAIVETLNNKELRDKQIKNGLESAAKFSWNSSAASFLQLL